MISGILNPTNWMGFAKELVKAEFRHFHFVIARYLYPSVAISNLHSPTMLDYFHKEDYIKANIPTKPLPQGMRNLVGLLFSAMVTSSIRHCEILSLPKQSEIIVVRPEPGLFQRFALKPEKVSSILEGICLKAGRPLIKIEAALSIMHKIAAINPRFASTTGVQEFPGVGMCREVGN